MKKCLLALLVLLISTHNIFADVQIKEQKHLLKTIQELVIFPAAIVGITLLIVGGLSYFDAKLTMENSENEENHFGILFWNSFFKLLKKLLVNLHWRPIYAPYQPYFSSPYYSPPMQYHPPLIVQTYTPVYTPTYIPMYMPMILR